MRVEILELAGGGGGMARADGKVWFVAGALPGEIVEAEVVATRAGIVEARAVGVFRPSPDRETAPCPILQECGGCSLGHVSRGAVAESLRQVTLGALRHAQADLGWWVQRAPVHLSPWGWRLRVRLAWDSGTSTLGFRRRRSHQVVGIAPCRVISPLLAAALDPLSEAMEAGSCGDGELVWLENLEGDVAVAGWSGPGFPESNRVRGLAGCRDLDGLRHARGDGWGESEVVMNLPCRLAAPIGAFFQGNRFLLPKLFDRVGEWAGRGGRRRVVDLYGGVGAFAAAATLHGIETVTVVESNPVAAAAASRNVPGATVVRAPAEEFLEQPGSRETVAILDPPRVGLSKAARTSILRWRPHGIVLLACDPAVFGRDAGSLLAAGYELQSLEIWDMFSGSHHVELVAAFAIPGC